MSCTAWALITSVCGQGRSLQRNHLTTDFTCMLQRFPNRSILTRLGQGIHNLPKSGSTVLVPATADSPSPKRRLRGGQNLSARWQRLEASLREKGSLMHTIDSLPISASLSTSTVDAGDLPVPSKISRPHVETFRGFIVPEAPQEPGPDGRLILLDYNIG